MVLGLRNWVDCFQSSIGLKIFTSAVQSCRMRRFECSPFVVDPVFYYKLSAGGEDLAEEHKCNDIQGLCVTGFSTLESVDVSTQLSSRWLRS